MEDGPSCFPQGFTCPVVLWIILVAFSFQLQGYYLLRRSFPTLFIYDIASMLYVRNPNEVNFIGLACSAFARRYLRNRISFSSSGYLDVSVLRVAFVWLCIHHTIPGHCSRWVAPFGNLRIDGCLHLPAAYRSLPRPSSAPDAKASALCSFSLDLVNPLRVPHDTRSVIFFLASHFSRNCS